ncbi:hypothetical protein B0T16DRAFT_322970 [Cercophora newfieldiana]|uniref:HSF-type DNA-binding domain-containing protein n=1 Tax=Cercophora newfieldiana TaxID=92897 RepID=A0AA39YGE0_9PEZI|nr:hypothetical protein B0T16DRAFT_322970 [Cercophora newfieldiana]
MSAPNPRKRPAPGASPMVPMPPLQQPFSSTQPDRLFQWNGGAEASGFVESGPPSVSSFTMMSPPGQYGAGAPSTALTRRQNNNRALVHTGGRPQFDPNSEPWTTFPNDPANFLQPPNGMADEDSIEELEKRALAAKRDAMAKRKQIPPFVQKLSSFLDEDRNTDLIRWSEKGDSFIVLDEDEFAKTLIPELFKHNNYASFVRQLNMYGFHKRVGLSDNSMRSSEKKFKSPSEYSNQFFRRGHPNLLWLINKGRGTSAKKKTNKKGDTEDGSDEEAVEEMFPTPGAPATQTSRVPTVPVDVGSLPKKELVLVKTEIERLQQGQSVISNMLNKLRQDQAALYQQALMFQNMHDRHENSINAILNFLANVFRKSLEGEGGTQSVQDLLSSILPNNGTAHNQPQMPQVVDLGDFVNRQSRDVATAVGTPKRPQRLLPPAPHHQVGKASTLSPSSTASPGPQAPYQVPQMGSVTELFDASPAESAHPSFIKDELRTNPQEGMMKIIQDTNAGNTSGIDLPNVALKTNATISHDQRDQMISIMAGHSSARSPVVNGGLASSPPPSLTAASTPGLRNAGLSLSPALSSLPPPNLQDIQATQAELDNLERLTNDQAGAINNLSSILGPLSPSGRIPGLDEHGNAAGYFGGSMSPYTLNNDYNVSDYLNDSAFTDAAFNQGLTGTTDGNDFNFTLDGNPADLTGSYTAVPAGNNMGGGFLDTGSGSAADTPSEAGTEEIPRNDLNLGSPERDPKRRRKA